MSISAIIIAAAVIGGIGLFVALFLGIAAIKFKVEVDEREEKILGVLPGNNCGGCGYAGCSGLAAAIVKGDAPVGACPVGGESVSKQVADIMGVQADASQRLTAFVKCAGTKDKTQTNYTYTGVENCKMLAFVPNGGPKSCNYGCLGYGNCVKVCPFDAVHITNGVAVVDKEKCKACGKCAAECPKNLIELIPDSAQHMVSCSSKEKGAIVMKECSVGCIGCGICKKNCPSDAITVENFLAYIDQSRCTNCGTCQEKCPKKTIA